MDLPPIQPESNNDRARCMEEQTSFIVSADNACSSPNSFVEPSLPVAYSVLTPHRSLRDVLTGLPNRAAAEEHICRLLADGNQDASKHFLFFLDLDYFKLVNDLCGHETGDELLQELSSLIHSVVREQDLLARFGGDEFLLVVRDVSEERALAIARRILTTVAEHAFLREGRQFQLSVSVGVAQIEGAPGELSRILAQADAACYRAKSRARGTLHVHSTEDQQTASTFDDLNWSRRIREAIRENRLELFVQHIVDQSGALLGVEGLIRMRDEAGHYISPGAFLPPAERTGTMPLIDRWVFKKGLCLLLQAETNPRLAAELGGHISLNLSARTLSSTDFIEWAFAEFGKARHVLKRLTIELTETEEGVWGTREVAAIRSFRELGIRVVLDDFGMGYNSFSVLKQTVFDGIKLDQQVVKGVSASPVDTALTVAAVTIANSLGIQLVAEGVENEVWLESLIAFGVTCFQGHLFHVAKALSTSDTRSAGDATNAEDVAKRKLKKATPAASEPSLAYA